MMQESLLPWISVVDVKHVICEIFLTIERIEMTQEICDLTLILIILNQVSH